MFLNGIHFKEILIWTHRKFSKQWLNISFNIFWAFVWEELKYIRNIFFPHRYVQVKENISLTFSMKHDMWFSFTVLCNKGLIPWNYSFLYLIILCCQKYCFSRENALLISWKLSFLLEYICGKSIEIFPPSLNF